MNIMLSMPTKRKRKWYFFHWVLSEKG